MILSTQNFTALVQNMAAAVQGACSSLLDLTVGSVLRATIEANASVALWLQWLILQVLSVTRLVTSSGTDVDSFINDFGMTRLPAAASTGIVTFSRLSASGTALVPVGAQVKTADGTQTFTVIADSTQAGWNAGLNGYTMANAVATVNATVQAAIAGSGGNVQAATITLLASAISGVDNVTNASGFTNGIDAESDIAVKARFQLYIAGLSKATDAAVGAAVESVQQGLSYTIVENSPTNGSFVVVVDDGTGSPPTLLLDNVFAAVNLVRPVGTSFTVIAPTITNVTITATLTVALGIVKANIEGTVDQAITAFVNELPVGGVLPYTKLAQVIYDSVAGITNVTGLLVNSATADINPGATGVVKATNVTMS